MHQAIAVVALEVSVLEGSNCFFGGGFGRNPVLKNEEIVYQMKGLAFRTWLEASLEETSKTRS